MRIIVLWYILIVSLCASPFQLTPQEKVWIEEHPVIDFVGDPDWLPFEAFEKGVYTGIVADYLKVIESRSSLHFNIIKTDSWDDSITAMQDKRAIMISQSKDSNRETGFHFTDRFYSNPIVIIMANKRSYVPSLYDIKDKIIAIVKTQPYCETIKEYYPHIHFKEVGTVNEGLSSVSTGESSAFVHTLAQASYAISQLQLNSLHIVGRTEFNTELGFGVSKENVILVEILNKIIHSIEPNIRQEILSKWITQRYVEEANYRPYIIGLLVLLGIIFIVVTYTFLLKKEMGKRTKAENTLTEYNKNLEHKIQEELILRKNQEKILEEQSRSAAMGEMMDAVAHQWKQPLNALSMYGELLSSDYKEGAVDEAYLNDMLLGVNTQIEHMTTTLNEFRNFFRPNKEVIEIDLEKSIASVLLLLKDELLKHAINVEIDLEKKITLNIVENEFKQVILNIINNAKDAFIEKDIAERKIKISALCSDDFIEISICDNAGGIPKTIINSIFKPNITTKAKGKGTGIGLYMSARIIEKSHGSIYAYNSASGACFSIELKKNVETTA